MQIVKEGKIWRTNFSIKGTGMSFSDRDLAYFFGRLLLDFSQIRKIQKNLNNEVHQIGSFDFQTL